MGKARRKTLTMLVTVSVPAGYQPADVRGIIRSVARNHSGLSVKSVKPAGRILAAAAKAFEAWGGGPKPRTRERLPLIDYINGKGAER